MEFVQVHVRTNLSDPQPDGDRSRAAAGASAFYGERLRPLCPTLFHAYPKAKCRYDQTKHGKIPCRKAKMGWVPFLGIFEHLVS